MFPEHIKSLRAMLETFPTEESCLAYLEYRRWGNDIRSPFDPEYGAWRTKNGKYICKKTRKYFTGRTKSIFEKTKIPLRDWFIAAWRLLSSKKGVSSVLLADELGVTQSTAWYMTAKLRRYLKQELEAKKDGIFSVDEAAFGGVNGNRHKNKKAKYAHGGHTPDKTWVFGITERGGTFRAYQMSSRDARFCKDKIRQLVSPGSVLISDAWNGYKGLNAEYLHYVVKDGEKNYEYNPEIHTNDIEGAWATLKRGYNGIYNWWSKKYLQSYLDEFLYRFNTRKLTTFQRFSLFLGNVWSTTTRKDILATTWI